MYTNEQLVIFATQVLIDDAARNLNMALSDLARADRIDAIDSLIDAERTIKLAIKKLRASVKPSRQPER
ncbi:MAG: hypothetical protein CVV18_00340 [Gammaproteobacteria bacterium HGW-Gammaproteobacteria-8]|jgi:hypothetical protein|nr:MAG: hypothetical protein CVV18_00340 [Gammaproteobacteria bacterium HGW-Gammaproteobacteria-8]